MNKFFGLAVVGGLLFVQATASQAINVTITLPPTSSAAAFAAEGAAYPGSDYLQGINTAAGDFTSSLTPGTNNLVLDGSNGFSSGFSYSPTIVGFGPSYPFGTPNVTVTDGYTNVPANFEYDLTENGGPTYVFIANGKLNGNFSAVNDSTGAPTNASSHVSWAFNGDTTGLFLYSIGGVPVGGTGMFETTSSTPNPVSGQPSGSFSFIYDPTGLNIPTTILIDNVDLIQPPGGPLSAIRGFIAITTVPEPSSVALLFGSGLTGSLLLRRRRRA
jgi:hypothetical protein